MSELEDSRVEVIQPAAAEESPDPDPTSEDDVMVASESKESDLAGLSKSLGESEEPSPLGDVKSSMVSWSKVEQTNTRGAEDEAQMNHNPIQQLMDACSDWEDPEHPISVKLRYTIKTGRMAQFREWLQDSIVAQSQSFPGYNGTVVFVPPGKAGQSKEGTICVAEVRYLGAQNLRNWLESTERSKLLEEALKAGFWAPGSRRWEIQDGKINAVDSWENAMLDGAGQQADANAAVERKPEVAKWAVVLFIIISVYIGNMLISWPVNSPGQYFRKTLGPALGTLVVQYMNTWQVNWVITPCLRPFVGHLLVQKRPNGKIFNMEPFSTLYEGFPWFRKGKSIPCAKYQIISGGPQKKKAKDPEEGRPATPPPVDKDRAEKMIDEQAENIIKEVNSQTMASKSSPFMKKEDSQVSVVLSQNVRKDKFSEFEAVIRDLGAANTALSAHEYVGTTIIRPKPDTTLYTIIVRFANKKALQEWLKSDQRKALLLEKQKYLITPVEAFASTYSILEMLGDSVGSNEKPPPAKFKTHWIVFVSLYSTTMFMSLFWGDSLRNLPFPLRLLIPQLFNTTIIGFLVIPFLSALLQRWLNLPRPKFYKNPKIKNFCLVRWIYEGFNDYELMYIVGLACGLYIGFIASGSITLRK